MWSKYNQKLNYLTKLSNKNSTYFRKNPTKISKSKPKVHLSIKENIYKKFYSIKSWNNGSKYSLKENLKIINLCRKITKIFLLMNLST